MIRKLIYNYLTNIYLHLSLCFVVSFHTKFDLKNNTIFIQIRGMF